MSVQQNSLYLEKEFNVYIHIRMKQGPKMVNVAMSRFQTDAVGCISDLNLSLKALQESDDLVEVTEFSQEPTVPIVDGEDITDTSYLSKVTEALREKY